MACRSFTLTNTGSTEINFNYQRCSDLVWEYQVQLLPGQVKNIWAIDNTYSIAPSFSSSSSLTNDKNYPPNIFSAQNFIYTYVEIPLYEYNSSETIPNPNEIDGRGILIYTEVLDVGGTTSSVINNTIIDNPFSPFECDEGVIKLKCQETINIQGLSEIPNNSSIAEESSVSCSATPYNNTIPIKSEGTWLTLIGSQVFKVEITPPSSSFTSNTKVLLTGSCEICFESVYIFIPNL